MAPPNRVENDPAFPARGAPVCDPRVSSCFAPEETPPQNSCPQESSQSSPASFVSAEEAGPLASYSRPTESSSPHSILTRSLPRSTPHLQGRERIVAILGSALTEELERAAALGESFPLELWNLADQLSQGRLPTAAYVARHHEIFDKSYQNADIDFLVHAVAVMVPGTAPIHATALRLNPNTEFYLTHRFEQNSYDWGLQQGLIASLSQSSSPDARTMLSSVPPSIRGQQAVFVAQVSAPSSRAAAISGSAGASAEGIASVGSRAIEQGLRAALSAAFRGATMGNPVATAVEGARWVLPFLGGGPLPIPFWQETLVLPAPSNSAGLLPSSGISSNVLPIAQRNPPADLMRFAETLEEMGGFLFGTREEPRAESPSVRGARAAFSLHGENRGGTPSASPSPTPSSQMILNWLSSPDPVTPLLIGISSPLLSSALSAAAVLQGSNRFNLLGYGTNSAQPIYTSFFTQSSIPPVTSSAEAHADADTSHDQGSNPHSSGGDSSQGRNDSEQEEKHPSTE